MRTTLVTIATSAFLTLSLHAQARPDFSGRWTTDPDPAAVQAADPAGAARGAAGQRGRGAGGGRGGRGDMGSGWGSTIAITQEAARLTVEYAFFSRGDMQPPMRLIYPLDDAETKNTVMMGQGMQVQTSRSQWDGDRLIVTTSHTFTNPETKKPETAEVRRVLSLESPTSLVVEVTRAGVLGGSPSTTRTLYRKL
jgi:hypothetical protein